MLNDRQLEVISRAIAPLFQYLEQEVIRDVARRILSTLTYSRTAELQASALADMGFSPAEIRAAALQVIHADAGLQRLIAENTMAYKRQIAQTIDQIVRQASEAGNTLVANAGRMAWIDDMRVWESHGSQLQGDNFLSQLVDAFQRQTEGELQNLTGTTAFKSMSGLEQLEDLYRKETEKALIKVASGAFTAEQAVRETVRDLAQSGLRTVNFESGYSMQLDTAATLAVRTSCHQLAGRVMDKNCETTGENLVYVSEHWGARNKGFGVENHEAWQGKVYYIKELEGVDYSEEAERVGQSEITDLYEATGYSADGAHASDPLGLYGYNCRHLHFVWFEGISQLPAKQPEPEPVEINGRTYDRYAATQAMRRREREIRALKREREAMERLPELYNAEDLARINVKIRQKTAEYQDFCRQAGIAPNEERLRYEAGTSDLTRTEAWKEYEKEYQDVAEGGNEAENHAEDKLDLEPVGEIVETNTFVEPENYEYTYSKTYSETTDERLSNVTPIEEEPKKVTHFIQDGEEYIVDGINVQFNNSKGSEEYDVAVLFQKKTGVRIEMMPEVRGKYSKIKTPDYLAHMDGKRVRLDMKRPGHFDPSSEKGFYSLLKDKRRQATKFLVDMRGYTYSEEWLQRQLAKVFRDKFTRYVDDVFVLYGIDDIRVFSRN